MAFLTSLTSQKNDGKDKQNTQFFVQGEVQNQEEKRKGSHGNRITPLLLHLCNTLPMI